MFQATIHLLFLGDAVLLFIAANSEGKQCLDIGTLCLSPCVSLSLASVSIASRVVR